MELIPFLTVARLLIPLLMFRFRFLGLAAFLVADMVDWLFLRFEIPSRQYFYYQNWDKAMDLYMFTIAAFIALSFKDPFIRKAIIIFYVIRAVGDILFFITGNQQILIFTPNFLETLLVFYVSYAKVTGKEILVKSWKDLALVLATIAITKLSHEYMLHFLRLNPWDLLDLGGILGLGGVVKEYFNYIIMGGLVLHFPPLLAWLYFVFDRNK